MVSFHNRIIMRPITIIGLLVVYVLVACYIMYERIMRQYILGIVIVPLVIPMVAILVSVTAVFPCTRNVTEHYREFKLFDSKQKTKLYWVLLIILSIMMYVPSLYLFINDLIVYFSTAVIVNILLLTALMYAGNIAHCCIKGPTRPRLDMPPTYLNATEAPPSYVFYIVSYTQPTTAL